MADEKQKPKGWDLDPIETVLLLLFISGLASGLLMTIRYIFTAREFYFYGLNLLGIANFFAAHATFFKTLGYLVAAGAALGAFVFNRQADAIWAVEKTRLGIRSSKNTHQPAITKAMTDDKPKINRWQEIIKKSVSDNPSDWRLAIIEADIMLDDLLRQLQLPGETMGEKLKAVDPPDFLTLDQAWEAHKARNMIAHEGDNFLLNQREVRRIVSLYESVFKEFHLI